MPVEAFEAVGVLGGKLDPPAVWTADDQGDIDLATGEVAQLGGVLDDLVGRLEREVPGHHFDDRAHPGHRHADGGAGEPVLRDRGVEHPARSELVDQAIGDEVGPTVNADILTDQDDTLVPLHFFRHRRAQGIAIGYDWHSPVPFLRRVSCRGGLPREAPPATNYPAARTATSSA